MFNLMSRAAAIAAVCILAACGGSDGNGTPAASSNKSFSLGGSINGLTDTGLVLAEGTNTVSVAANATSFSLGAILARGAAYAVTVQTQPANGVCSIANGSGTAANADVGNVVVTCSTQAFALGGSVSGLNAAGLVLANGTDTSAVAADSTAFILPTLVASGSSYTVTVQTQPTGEACAVANGAATMPAQTVASIAVTCTDQPFSLGGTITGLTTAGLVIGNGITVTGLDSSGQVIAHANDTVSEPIAASTFTLPTPVPYDSPYALLVATQPTGLMCSFSSGGTVASSSGLMPASNITSAALVCSPQSYALGGSVTGLVGSLALTDGTDSLTVDAAGSQDFTLPTPVAYNTQYALSVQTQPIGLTCTPGSNSTGLMPAGPVSVTVTCSPLSYTLGGSITDLTSTGLVLSNGSGNTVSPAAGATQFTLPQGVAFDSAYNVTASSQPQGQTCAATVNSGTMPAANVNTVQVACYANTFTTAGGPYSWTVPPGITSVQIVATGAGGGGSPTGGTNNTGGAGGSGALVTSILTVQPGDSLTIYVGGGGAAGQSEGGGGGGMTYVADGAAFIVAGGGGGAGGGPGTDGAGGNAGVAGSNGGQPAVAGTGGAPGGAGNGNGGAAGTGGGIANATAGLSFTTITTVGSGSGGNGGGAILESAGGSGISGTIGNGGTGAYGVGAGGGGGGYGGGGGGSDGALQNNQGSGGGGGGGSTGPAGTLYGVAPNSGPGAGGSSTGGNGNDGSVVINIL